MESSVDEECKCFYVSVLKVVITTVCKNIFVRVSAVRLPRALQSRGGPSHCNRNTYLIS